jgi:hypothetical protein
MRSMRRVLFLVLIGLPIALVAQSCDPEKVALDVFRKQGLTLLRPARTYIEVGAIVVQPSSGQPRYIDPLDTVPTEEKPTVDFDAVIMSEVQKRTTTLGTALSLVAQVVTVPVGLKFDRSREVTLSQIDTGGVRLRDKALEALIKRPSTSAKLKEHLKVKRKAYVIQEIYRSATMNVAATTGGSLSVGVGGGDVPECTPPKGEGDKTKEKEAATAKSKGQEAAPSTAQDQQKSGQPSTSQADAAKKKVAEEAAAEAKDPEKATSSVGVCFANQGKTVLAFKSEKPLPFAVRLAEIELVGGDLRVKIGDFKFPGSLGTSEVERSTAFFGGQPVVRGLIRGEQ